VLTAIFYLNPIALMAAHSILTESVCLAALYAASAEVVRITVRNERMIPACIWFCGWIAIAFLTKHIGIMFGAMLPAALLTRCVRSWWVTDRPAVAANMRGIALACGGLITVALGILQVENATMRALGIEPRSILGRAFVYRLSGAVSTYLYLTADELKAVISRLEAGTKEAQIARDLRLMYTDPAPWVGAYQAVLLEVQQACPTCPSGKIHAQADRRLNAASAYALKSMDPDLLRDAVLRTAVYFVPTLHTGSLYPFAIWGWGEPYLYDSKREQFNPAHLATWFAVGPRFAWRANAAADGMTNSIGFASAAVALMTLLIPALRRRLLPAATGLFAGTLFYAFASSVVTVWTPRYSALVGITGLVSVVLLCHEILARKLEGHRGGHEAPALGQS
jgi:hypothetical protein